MKMYHWFEVWLLTAACLVLTSSEQSEIQYNCPYDAVQLITSSQLINSSVVMGNDFDRVVETSHYLQTFFWEGRIIPNSGSLIFEEPYVLLGLTTAGEYSSITNRQSYYVQNFTLQYSDSLNDSFVTYPQDFVVNNPDEKVFYFERSLVFQRLNLLINNGTIAGGHDWRLVLIGCQLANATVVPTPPLSSNSNSMTSSPSISQSNNLPSLITSLNTCNCPTTSTSIVSRVTTVTITNLVSDTTLPIADGCQEAVILPSVIIPLLLLSVLIAVLLIVVGVCFYKYGTKHKESFEGKRRKQSSVTLKEVSNAQIYTMTDQQSDYNMTYNALYVHSEADPSDSVYYTEADSYKKAPQENAYETPEGIDTYETPADGVIYEEASVIGAIYEETPGNGFSSSTQLFLNNKQN